MNDEIKGVATPAKSAKRMLSKNFSLEEMTATTTGLPNVPNEKHIGNLTALAVNVLQKIRDGLGKPVKGTSFFRSPEVNAKVKGAVNSQHTLGRAGDIEVEGVPNADLWHFIVDPKNGIEFDQCIAEHLSETDPKAGWVHVSFNAEHNRREAFSIIKMNGQNVNRPGLVFEA